MRKLHQDPEFLKKAIDMGSNSREIAKELRVSYKLVELYLEKHNIPFKSMRPPQNDQN